jgi:hypothetical protein
MTSDSDSDIDRRLQEEGDRWRQGVPVELDVDTRALRGRTAGTPVRILLTIGTVGVLAASIAVLAGLRAPFGNSQMGGDTGTAQPQLTEGISTTSSLVVRSGDTVVGTGSLMARGSDLFLCPTEPVAITGGFGCLGTDLVRVIGGDSETWDGGYAQVEGIWDGESLHAAKVTRAQRPADARWRPVPCDPPTGGWPGVGPSEAAESAGRDLEQEVNQHPELYVGIWPAVSAEAAGAASDRVIVVGTVGDVAEVAGKLSAIYPFNLCVTAVEFSAADLQPVLDQLMRLDEPWHVDIEPSVDRVVVTTTALGPSSAEAIVGFADKVEVRATLRRVSPDS